MGTHNLKWVGLYPHNICGPHIWETVSAVSCYQRGELLPHFVECHFFIVLWSLAGDLWQITCSFIAFALDIHIFCLHAEAEGAILHTMKKF